MSTERDTSPASSQTDDGGFLQRLFRFTPNDLLRLLFLCVLVGLLLAAFNVDPRRLWVDFFGTLVESWASVVSAIVNSAGHAVEYLLLGAVLVVPIWLFMRVLGAMRRD
ncbi:MAG: DUF6460 domain-containing protein [Maricaulis sp.]|jgi:Na+/H+-dicarboxylate symporter|uniref:DUF6460 domain-containing protein n=1 Tax=Maricaulis sp. TaxID=1486257 RepID=UPI001B115489|nr:DUF6460 domain-containing protein [Maricaulis sp.]MBO6728882.1 hypothetical protein [Maricaulis sp.]MBO6846914.1 hypothetical protein [Maricaulis sp.]MBO6876273.1 hypothetical protein [Maricaulis sp.]MDM7984508.1 DUF6460 domain-containing protein [Maricaulis sp.]